MAGVSTCRYAVPKRQCRWAAPHSTTTLRGPTISQWRISKHASKTSRSRRSFHGDRSQHLRQKRPTAARTRPVHGSTARAYWAVRPYAGTTALGRQPTALAEGPGTPEHVARVSVVARHFGQRLQCAHSRVLSRAMRGPQASGASCVHQCEVSPAAVAWWKKRLWRARGRGEVGGGPGCVRALKTGTEPVSAHSSAGRPRCRAPCARTVHARARAHT